MLTVSLCFDDLWAQRVYLCECACVCVCVRDVSVIVVIAASKCVDIYIHPLVLAHSLPSRSMFQCAMLCVLCALHFKPIGAPI